MRPRITEVCQDPWIAGAQERADEKIIKEITTLKSKEYK